MAAALSEGNEKDMTQEIEFLRACLNKYSDVKVLKLCASQPFLNDGDIELFKEYAEADIAEMVKQAV